MADFTTIRTVTDKNDKRRWFTFVSMLIILYAVNEKDQSDQEEESKQSIEVF